MLSYQHGYHAGNFADVHKHVILSFLLDKLKQKPNPFCVIDTHAGSGLYELNNAQAQKNREYLRGIQQLANKPLNLLAPYWQSVQSFNSEKSDIHLYPGSPWLSKKQLREEDRLVLIEKHPTELLNLKKSFKDTQAVSIHQRDAYEGLLALVPPKERRGLVLVDPSYENKEEYSYLPEHLGKALKKWPTGIYAVWYPILPAHYHLNLLEGLKAIGSKSFFFHEFLLETPPPHGLQGSGMAILNPPWDLEGVLAQAAIELNYLNLTI